MYPNFQYPEDDDEDKYSEGRITDAITACLVAVIL